MIWFSTNRILHRPSKSPSVIPLRPCRRLRICTCFLSFSPPEARSDNSRSSMSPNTGFCQLLVGVLASSNFRGVAWQKTIQAQELFLLPVNSSSNARRTSQSPKDPMLCTSTASAAWNTLYPILLRLDFHAGLINRSVPRRSLRVLSSQLVKLENS